MAVYFFGLLLALGLAACGGSGDTDPMPPKPMSEREADELMSSKLVDTITATEIQAGLSDSESKVKVGVTPVYDVTSYRVTYITTNKDGAKFEASGLISVPVKQSSVPSPVLSYQHATTFRNEEVPSIKVEAVGPPMRLASVGYIVVAADYVGFGATNDQEHPYLNAAPSAAAVVDLLKYGVKKSGH